MKKHVQNLLALLALLSTIYAPLSTARAQGTAFTYQGQLQNSGVPVSGTYNLQFSLYTNSAGGTPVAGPVTNRAVFITNGLFTVPIDFGAGPWNGQTNWLQIGVETNGGGGFTLLTPLQQLTPAPYAIYAVTAGAVSGISVQPNADGAPNVIGGSPANFVASGVEGATIAGGGSTNFFATVVPNIVTGDFGTVGGGLGNAASNVFATVAGGGGNTAGGSEATVGGGGDNTASGNYATVAGGQNNTASGITATVAGGYNNLASGDYSFAAGQDAQAAYDDSFVWSDGSGTTTASGTGQFVARASGGFVLFTVPGDGLWINSGRIGIDISSPANSIDLNGFITARGSGSIWTFGAGSGGDFGFILGTSGSSVAYIDTSGNYHQVSDRGLKRDITSLDNTLDRLLQLRPVSYHFNSAPNNAPLSLGFIAQEVQPLFPEVVGEQTNGVKDLVYSELVPVAIRSIQELNQKLEDRTKVVGDRNQKSETRIQSLETDNMNLQSQVTDLRSQLENLQQAVARLASKTTGASALNNQPQEAK